MVNLAYERNPTRALHGVYITKIGGKSVPKILVYRSRKDDFEVHEATVYCALVDGLLSRITAAIVQQ